MWLKRTIMAVGSEEIRRAGRTLRDVGTLPVPYGAPFSSVSTAW